MMNAISRWALALASAAGLSACGQSGPDQRAGNDVAAHGNLQAADDPYPAEGNDPYPESEMKMHEAMTSAVGADASDTWVRKMIEHHQGAIAMSNYVVAHGNDTRVIPIARRLVAKQQREVEELQRLIRQDAAPDPASAQPYRAAETQMHEAMLAAKGSDSSHTWIRKMIPHHQGAIAMSRIVLAQGKDERVSTIARRIIADQETEIAELRAMLSGAGVQHGPSAMEAPASETTPNSSQS